MASGWRGTREYRVWRAIVIRRDVRCQVCGSIKGRTAHHKNSGSYFPEERYLPENGVCLCSRCHTKFHTDYKRSFRTKCTEYDFENFMSLVRYFKKIFRDKEIDG